MYNPFKNISQETKESLHNQNSPSKPLSEEGKNYKAEVAYEKEFK